MLKAKVNGADGLHVEFEDKSLTHGAIGNEKFELDLAHLTTGSWHLLLENRSWNIELLEVDSTNKTYALLVNGKRYEVALEDRYDALLKNLGMDGLNSQAVKEMKAPMPGLVLDVYHKEGETVKAGDPLLVLEAMKMENVLKSPADGTISKVAVQTGEAVEKNQVLVHFEL